jgi:CRP/FNR family transcriptional regulator, cyclic AMP receptor protein
MYLKQSDLFWELNHDFVKAVMGHSVKQTFESGQILFREGDAAGYFYVLIKGRIRLTIGDGTRVVHTVSRAGECFGWSALLDRKAYSAAAECRQPSELILIDAHRFTRTIEEDPVSGMRFMKRLAAMLGNRLIANYQVVSSLHAAETARSYGTNQVAEAMDDIQ